RSTVGCPPSRRDSLFAGDATRSALTGDYMVTYYDRRGRRPGVQGPRRPDATSSPRPALRARRPHAHRARVGAGDDALRGHEAPACSRRRRARGHAAAGPGEAALPQPGPDPSRPRPLDRQVHGAPRLGARGSQERTGVDCMTTMTAQTTQVYSIFIKATPEQIWDAITKPEFSHKYFYGSYVTVTPEAYRGLDGEGGDLVIGTVLEYEPPARLVHSWSAMYDAEVAGEDASRVTWEIEAQEGGYSKLTVVHDQLEASPKTAESVARGWSYVLSGLKTLLETGEPLAGCRGLRGRGDRDATTRLLRERHGHLGRIEVQRRRDVVPDLHRKRLREGALVPEAREVELQRLRLEAESIGAVRDAGDVEVGLRGDWADRSE